MYLSNRLIYFFNNVPVETLGGKVKQILIMMKTPTLQEWDVSWPTYHFSAILSKLKLLTLHFSVPVISEGAAGAVTVTKTGLKHLLESELSWRSTKLLQWLTLFLFKLVLCEENWPHQLPNRRLNRHKEFPGVCAGVEIKCVWQKGEFFNMWQEFSLIF